MGRSSFLFTTQFLLSAASSQSKYRLGLLEIEQSSSSLNQDHLPPDEWHIVFDGPSRRCLHHIARQRRTGSPRLRTRYFSKPQASKCKAPVHCRRFNRTSTEPCRLLYHPIVAKRGIRPGAPPVLLPRSNRARICGHKLTPLPLVRRTPPASRSGRRGCRRGRPGPRTAVPQHAAWRGRGWPSPSR